MRNYGNCTEWNAIWAEIIRVVSKSNERRSASSIWNHKYDFRPKLHHPKFNYHFIRSILKSRNLIAQKQELQDFSQYQYLLNQVAKFAKQWLFYLSFFCNVIG